MTRKKWQEKKWQENHEKIITALNQEKGLTKQQLHTKTGLSRRIINNHLKALISHGDVIRVGTRQKGTKFYLKTDYEKLSEWTSKVMVDLKGWLDSLVKGEEFWLWLPNMEHPEKILKFKMYETKILRQD